MPRSALQTPHQGSDIPEAPTIRDSTPPRGFRFALPLVIALWAIVVAIRLTGPSDLLDNDQLHPAAYANDALVNAHWLAQTDVGGDIASKPPLTIWIIGLLSLPEGHATPLTLAIPSALGVLGCMLLTYAFGARWFGRTVGLVGALALLLSPMGAKQVTLVRTDAVFAFLVGLTTLLVWRAWRRGRGWFWVWLIAAALTLTKGPVGIPIALAGLLAGFWERRTRARDQTEPDRPPRQRRPAEHILGAACFFLLTGGWLFLAWRAAGQPFIDKVIGDELIGHAVRSHTGGLPFVGFYLPPLYYLSRFAPASVFTFLAIWHTWKHPSSDMQIRVLERFLACGFVVGMLFFCVSPHLRPDLLTPLWIPGSLLAGREIVRLGASFGARARVGILAIWVVLAMGAIFLKHNVLAQRSDAAQRAQGLSHLAHEIEQINPSHVPLLHVDDNSALQFYLGTMNLRVTPEAAAQALARPEPILVATASHHDELDAALEPLGVETRVVASWEDAKGWGVRILANRAALESVSE